jgi:transposase-like protein
MVIMTQSVTYWLWRAVDGGAPEILAQRCRIANAAKQFLQDLMKQWCATRVILLPLLAFIRKGLPNSGHAVQL